jgi:hypothetical protein
MGKKPFLNVSVVWIALLMVTSCTWGPQQFYDNGVSDEEYVSTARLHDDAQAFLAAYPQAETYVDRSGALAVDFRVTKSPVTSTTQRWEGIRVRVFIDPRTKQPTETLIQCNDKMIRDNVRQYLEQYLGGETCP